MSIKMLLITAGTMCLMACSAPIQFYPIKGPFAEQNPIPTITAVATGLISGTISLTLPNGEICSGSWAEVARESDNRELASTWDTIYGQGYFVANVVGAIRHASATLHGKLGTTIILECYKSTVEHSPLIGVAKDNHGNIYKITQ